MGINPEPEYGLNCNTCFAPGKTPKRIFIWFMGVQTGFEWRPGMPAPPSGQYILTQTAPCFWAKPIGPGQTSYGTNLPGTVINFNFGMPFFAFGFFNLTNCLQKGVNQIVNGPGAFYHAGHARIEFVK